MKGYQLVDEEGMKDLGTHCSSLLKTFLGIEKEIVCYGGEPISNDIEDLMEDIKKKSGYGRSGWVFANDFDNPVYNAL